MLKLYDPEAEEASPLSNGMSCGRSSALIDGPIFLLTDNVHSRGEASITLLNVMFHLGFLVHERMNDEGN